MFLEFQLIPIPHPLTERKHNPTHAPVFLPGEDQHQYTLTLSPSTLRNNPKLTQCFQWGLLNFTPQGEQTIQYLCTAHTWL